MWEPFRDGPSSLGDHGDGRVWVLQGDTLLASYGCMLEVLSWQLGFRGCEQKLGGSILGKDLLPHV